MADLSDNLHYIPARVTCEMKLQRADILRRAKELFIHVLDTFQIFD